MVTVFSYHLKAFKNYWVNKMNLKVFINQHDFVQNLNKLLNSHDLLISIAQIPRQKTLKPNVLFLCIAEVRDGFQSVGDDITDGSNSRSHWWLSKKLLEK
jgi:hypothetical protein